MDKYIKQNKYPIIIIPIVVILGFLFYWFQIRPTNIKKNCSWTTETIEADPGITKEQVEQNKIKCKTSVSKTSSSNMFDSTPLGCSEDIKERPPQPEYDETTEATKEEYDMCLRQHGL